MIENNKELNVFDIENVAGELERAIDLFGLIDEEVADLATVINLVKDAKTPEKKHEARSLLVIQVENRLKYLDALQCTVSNNIIKQKEALDKMVRVTTRSFNTDKGEMKNETK